MLRGWVVETAWIQHGATGGTAFIGQGNACKAGNARRWRRALFAGDRGQGRQPTQQELAVSIERNGKEGRMGLGSFLTVGLSEARPDAERWR
jgi:hypothetical protein